MLSKFSVKKPVTITMMIFIVLLLGFVSFSKLSVDLMPSIELPIAIVQTSYAGVGPEEIENMIVKPLEQVLVTIENIETVTSICNEGSSIILLQFNFDTDMDATSLEIREKIDIIKGFLPEGATNPMVMKMDPNSMPIMQIAIANKGDIYTTQKIAEDIVQPRIERIEGAASANVSGGLEREIEIILKEDKLRGYNLNSSYISQILQAENLNLPGGSVSKGNNELTVRTLGEFKSVEEIRNLNIPLTKGGTVRLRDLADVNLVNKDKSTITRLDGQDVVIMSVMKQSDGNTVNVAKKVNDELNKIRGEYPELNISVIFDQSEYINSSISNLAQSAILGASLAVIILLIFLKSLKTTVIIAVSIPISIVTTFVLLYFAGITLNMMTIGGLALGVGMLVDNSIVVLENIHRHRSLGFSREDASILGANEVSMAVTASTFTTIAVFIPIVFTGGIASTIFKDFALSIVMALLGSLAVALTLVPMMSSKLITVKYIATEDEQEKKHSFFVVAYKKGLHWCLKHRIITISLSIVLFISSIAMAVSVGAEFFPATDQGQANINVTLPIGSELKDTENVLKQIQDTISDIPEIDMVASSVGGASMMASGNGANTGILNIVMKPLGERDKSTKEISEIIRQRLKDIPGAEMSIAEVSMVMMGSGGSSISISVKGDDMDTLKAIGEDFEKIIESVSGTRDVSSSYSDGIPEVQIAVDRSMSSQYGLTTAQIGSGIKNTLSGSTVTKFKLEGNEIDVKLKGDNIYGQSLSLLGMIPISTQSGGTIPLSEVADIRVQKGPVSIVRENQTRVMTVSSSILGRDVQSVSTDIIKLLSEYEMPKGYTYSFGGDTEQIAQTFGDLFLAIGMAVILVYMILAAQFESMIQPLSILFSVPLALSGGFIGLFITGTPLSVVGLIGFIMLVGIVVNNAIVLIDYINQRRRLGEDRTDAILKAGPIRIKPIMMTALTTILGLVPMVIGLGEGSELTKPMAVVVIGGLLLSTLLTLVFVPVIYSIFDDITRIFKKIFKLDKEEKMEQIQ